MAKVNNDKMLVMLINLSDKEYLSIYDCPFPKITINSFSINVVSLAS